VPTYEYACTVCAERLEAVQKFTDPALTECPACGGTLRKVFSPVGVVFKGSGFYKTDSRKPAKSGSSSSDSSSSSSSAAGSSDSSGSSSSAGDSAGGTAPATPSTTSSTTSPAPSSTAAPAKAAS
jgi:putative FmdB family regulatory protein